ncbi:hypothetical protein [Anthocerotibacter panamensis]|uniref:hypothetical protein n=1 Tax=Anthocerotibacter panamensis TaxID=2857077 RepID=UPI001C405E76|nr:hypothetical protein [Anthocerotibacter panamensis]
MRHALSVCGFLLVGCTPASPPPAVPPDPNLKALTLEPTSGAKNFLLVSSGSPYIDPDGNRLGELEVKGDDRTYTTRLGMVWSKQFNPANQVKTYLLTVTLAGPIDETHTFSDNKPTAFLEVDGEDLPNGRPIDFPNGSFISVQNLKRSTPPRLEIELSEEAVKVIEHAKDKVTLKVQLKTDRIARSTSCFGNSGSVDDYLDCRFPYTGRNLSGAELSRLKALLVD